MARVREKALAEKLAQLEKARPWSSRTADTVGDFVRTATDEQLFRINPISFAAATHVAETEAIDLFLHGTKLGMFQNSEWL